MAVRASVYRYQLHFKEPAMTSRGTYVHHAIWYVLLEQLSPSGSVEAIGLGECAPLPDLSPEYMKHRTGAADETKSSVESRYGAVVCEAVQLFAGALNAKLLCGVSLSSLSLNDLFPCNEQPHPAIVFALETALLQLQHGGSWRYIDSPFSRGSVGIPINGLIWMGNIEQMSERIATKVEQGYRCIKLKIGAQDFEREFALLEQLRSRFSASQLELRVDANGAFSVREAMGKLERLSTLQLHSIEQPIKAGKIEAMRDLCAHSPLPIALDEELIGVTSMAQRERLLDSIAPQYIVLKPTLHGGLIGTKQWLEAAAARGIGAWLTSALESNIGLNAIAQYDATAFDVQAPDFIPQGLGTGLLYTNNVTLPLTIQGDCLTAQLPEAGSAAQDSLTASVLKQIMDSTTCLLQCGM